MSVVQFKLESSPTFVDGRLESLYLVFREGVTARETIAFECRDEGRALGDGIQILVDVDDRDIPIALQFVISIELQPGELSLDHAQSAAVPLFAFATQMVTFHRANQQARGNALIRDAVACMSALVPSCSAFAF